MKIYDRIKMLRKHIGMSQEELAHRCGYSERSMISRIEAGSVDLPFSKIEVFANALGVDPAYLAGFSDWQRTQDRALEIPDQYIQKSGGWKSDAMLKSIYRNTLDDVEEESAELFNSHLKIKESANEVQTKPEKMA